MLYLEVHESDPLSMSHFTGLLTIIATSTLLFRMRTFGRAVNSRTLTRTILSSTPNSCAMIVVGLNAEV